MRFPIVGLLPLAALLLLSRGSSEQPSQAILPLPSPSAANGFGAKLLEVAIRDLGLRESSTNSGPEIDTALRDVGVDPGNGSVLI